MGISRKFTCATLALFLMLVGCSQEGKKADAQPAPPKKEAAAGKETNPDHFASTELEDMLRQGPGKYGGKYYDEKKVKEEIARFPRNLSAEEYYRRLLALVAEDYRPYHQFFSGYDTTFDEPGAQPGTPAKPGQPIPGGKTINVQVLFDASGSMAGRVNGGVKMDLAKKAVKDFLSDMPENVNVSLRVYGHKGSNSERDKAVSCGSTEEVYRLGPYDEKKFAASLNRFKPTGWTPLAASIRAAAQDLSGKTGDHVQNLVYIVSDGVETCGGDPTAEAKRLHESDIQAVVNIIGFDVDDKGQQSLKQVAEAGGGTFSTVNSKQDLDAFFEKEKTRLIDEWFDWEAKNVDKYFQTEAKRVDELFDKENEMVNLAFKEEERLKDLSYYMEQVLGIDGYEIRQMAFNRGYALRQYARNTAYQLREAVRDGAYEHRQKVRNKAYEERQDLRNQD